MGFWNKSGDGSVEIPMSNITEAVLTLDNRVLSEAIEQLKVPGQFTDMLNSSSAASQLIETLSKLYLQQFQQRVELFQDTNDPLKLNDSVVRFLGTCSAPECHRSNGRLCRPECKNISWIGCGVRAIDAKDIRALLGLDQY